MKRYLLHLIDRLADRLGTGATRLVPLKKAPGASFDVIEVAHLKAALESADYYERNLITARAFDCDLNLLNHAISLARGDGLWLEFGVARGRTINHIAALRDLPIYGFNSFEGLPEAWRTGFEKGALSAKLPTVPNNVTLVKGWFADTLPSFLADHAGRVSFLHIDCDLYSSTKTIFDLLTPRLSNGCVIVFDEYWNYPGWQHHERKAFAEFTDKTRIRYRYDSFVPTNQQVCVVLE